MDASIIVALAVAVPFRMTLGLSGGVLIARQHEQILLTAEVLRLLITSGALIAGALIDPHAFVWAASLAVVGAHLLRHGACAKVLPIVRPPRIPHVVAAKLAGGVVLAWNLAS